jgi:predicted tellurium resistance membrane protein TerC
MMELLYDPNVWASFITLTIMELVLGIDNIVFISVIVNKLPAEQAERARRIGLLLALVFRIILLVFLTWIIGLQSELFQVVGHSVSWRDIILFAGGVFLIYKATAEIHEEFEGETDEVAAQRLSVATFSTIIGQIILIDLVFSVDSIVTAIGMAQHVEVMIAAVIVAVGVMYVAAGTVSSFIKRHPTTKMLALAFLMLIGVSLVADGMGFHIPRGYIYAAMGFSVCVEAINIMLGRKKGRKI